MSADELQKAIDKFTFHYVSIKTGLTIASDSVDKLIYIPLCIY